MTVDDAEVELLLDGITFDADGSKMGADCEAAGIESQNT